MRYTEIILKTQREPDALEIIKNFIEFAAEELDLSEMPRFILMTGNTLGTTFGAYAPGAHTIYLEIGNRHPVDVLRTLAHEMVHYRQDLNDELHDKSGEDGSEHENEANAEAGRIMRKFGKANPDLYRSGPIMEGRESEILHREEGDPGDLRVFQTRAPDGHEAIEYQADSFSWTHLRRIIWKATDELPSIRFQVVDRSGTPKFFIMGEPGEIAELVRRLDVWNVPHIEGRKARELARARRRGQ